MSTRLFRGSLKWIWILTGNSPQPRRVKWNGGSLTKTQSEQSRQSLRVAHRDVTVRSNISHLSLVVSGGVLITFGFIWEWRPGVGEEAYEEEEEEERRVIRTIWQLRIRPAEHCHHLFRAASKLLASKKIPQWHLLQQKSLRTAQTWCFCICE